MQHTALLLGGMSWLRAIVRGTVDALVSGGVDDEDPYGSLATVSFKGEQSDACESLASCVT